MIFVATTLSTTILFCLFVAICLSLSKDMKWKHNKNPFHAKREYQQERKCKENIFILNEEKVEVNFLPTAKRFFLSFSVLLRLFIFPFLLFFHFVFTLACPIFHTP